MHSNLNTQTDFSSRGRCYDLISKSWNYIFATLLTLNTTIWNIN